MNPLTHRRLSLGTLRAFDAVARRLNFRAAAEELHLTQPAVSRQIRALEAELGMPLFIRGTRHVELTQAGTALMQAVSPWLETLDDTVRRLRAQRRRQPVALTTFASLASMWLLPRLAEFQAAHPDIDIRISATDALADLDDPELDLALRNCRAEDAPPGSVPLFDEVLTPVASPSLLARTPLRRPADLARHTLLEEQNLGPIGTVHSWRAWLARQGAAGVEPRGWLVLDFTYQQIQAALAGQGVALARLALVVEALRRGELVEPFGASGRLASPWSYWLVRWPVRRERTVLAAFEAWLIQQAHQTQQELGGTPGVVGSAVDTSAFAPPAPSRSRARRLRQNEP
jgi:LysR family glycine cleavage system transcriptional activator